MPYTFTVKAAEITREELIKEIIEEAAVFYDFLEANDAIAEGFETDLLEEFSPEELSAVLEESAARLRLLLTSNLSMRGVEPIHSPDFLGWYSYSDEQLGTELDWITSLDLPETHNV